MSARVFHSVLDAVGPQSAAIERLWWLMFWTTAAVFSIVLIVFALALVRGMNASAPRESSVLSLKTAVSGAVAATVVILFVLLVSSFYTGRAIASPVDKGAVTIEVIGHQWWWEIIYDDALPQRRVTLANEIHVPIGRPVVVKVTSRDVIHSLWIPNLSGKRDLIPGYTTAIWMQADEPGVYRGQCAEFCGKQHAHMALAVVAEPEDSFEGWLAAERRNANAPSDEPARRGEAVFMANRCSGCHTIRGTESAGQVGPDLTHIARRSTLGAGALPNEQPHMTDWLKNPQSAKPGNQMPPNPLADGDLQALVAYLETLK